MVAMKTKPSRPTTSSTTHQVLSGRWAVFSTAPIQATKCATAANSKSKTASPIRPSKVHDNAPDLIPVVADYTAEGGGQPKCNSITGDRCPIPSSCVQQGSRRRPCIPGGPLPSRDLGASRVSAKLAARGPAGWSDGRGLHGSAGDGVRGGGWIAPDRWLVGSCCAIGCLRHSRLIASALRRPGVQHRAYYCDGGRRAGRR